MRPILRLMIVLLLAAVLSPAGAMSVTFINPGKSSEMFWHTSARAAEEAARALGVDLELIYLERQHLAALEVVRGLAARPAERRPDYVMLVNEGGVAPEALRILDEAGLRPLLVYSGIQGAQERALVGTPRDTYRHWLGSIEPRAEEAGYLTAKALIDKGREARAFGPDGKLHLLAIAADRATPTSIRRSEGMRKAVEEAGDAVLDQEVFGAFSREKATEQSAWLFQRFPQARLVWAANDQMAFGAMASWEARGGQPGHDAWFSGINTSGEAMKALRSGRLTALSGGHFIVGAWAVVMLYDYHHGVDFADSEGLELSASVFPLFSVRDADTFERRYGEGHFDAIDFRRFSKVHNPAITRYDFGFRQLLKGRGTP